jgi:DNA-binding XRE family transcriptional regulator
MTRQTAVYRYYGADGSLIYVGVSHSPLARHGSHCGKAPWANQVETIKIKWYPTAYEALLEEWTAITQEKPAQNKSRPSTPPRPPIPHADQLDAPRKSIEEMSAKEQIEAFLSVNGRKKAWLAKQVGVDRTTLSQWLSGAYRPGEPSRIKMHQICGVHPDTWGRV